jgi:hypothetical protein
MYLLFILIKGAQRLNELEIFALVLVALCYDFDRLGFMTNAFPIVASDSIALWYNDKVVLESHHVATALLTMRVVACIS